MHNPRGGYVAFVGRISPEKRPDRAIRIARTLGIPLKIAVKIDKVDEACFREKIAPLLSDPGGRVHREPFGLVMIEAIARGTPVLAFRRFRKSSTRASRAHRRYNG